MFCAFYVPPTDKTCNSLEFLIDFENVKLLLTIYGLNFCVITCEPTQDYIKIM